VWAAALATGILCVWQHVYSSQLASDIEALQERRERVEAEIGFLDMRCAELSSRERIEGYASVHLDMRYPESGEVVRLGKGLSRPARADRDEYVLESKDGAVDG
jgi:cell division protein FtsL